MKKIILMGLLVTTWLMAGFGTSSKDNPIYLKGSDGNQYEYVMCGASATGSYNHALRKIADLLGSNMKTGKPIAVAETTDGTQQNVELMNNGICNVIMVQGDYLNFIKKKQPQFFEHKAFIQLDRKEHVQLVMRKGGNEDDLQNKKARILVGLHKSGGAASWKVISQLEPGYAKTAIEYGDIDLSSLTDLKNHKIDAIVKTAHFAHGSQFTQDVIKDPKIEFVDFDDKDINDEIDFGEGPVAIYEFKKTIVEAGFFAMKRIFPTTKVVIVIDKKNMSHKQLVRFMRIISEQRTNMWK